MKIKILENYSCGFESEDLRIANKFWDLPSSKAKFEFLQKLDSEIEFIKNSREDGGYPLGFNMFSKLEKWMHYENSRLMLKPAIQKDIIIKDNFDNLLDDYPLTPGEIVLARGGIGTRQTYRNWCKIGIKPFVNGKRAIVPKKLEYTLEGGKLKIKVGAIKKFLKIIDQE